MDSPSTQSSVMVDLGSRSYEIAIVSSQMETFASHLGDWLSRLEFRTHGVGSALIVTDHNVRDPHAESLQKNLAEAGWQCELMSLEPGEQTKSIATVSQVFDRLVEMKADRHTIVIAAGGGVVGDTAGFVAATYARGVPYAQVPTSLLAQVDSSVGGKVAVNHPQGKNLIGAFYQPMGVFIDTSTLDTLADREYRSGLGEVIKYGVILDPEFFEYLESNVDGLNDRSADVLRHVVSRCCRLKADVVEQDEFERTGLRSVLNYGHTFCHAFEALCGYGELLHGEAVAIGMVYASRLAEQLKKIDRSVTERQIALLQAVGLATRLPESKPLSSSDILDRMYLDKKVVAGQLRFVLPTRLGHVELFKDVSEEAVLKVLDELG